MMQFSDLQIYLQRSSLNQISVCCDNSLSSAVLLGAETPTVFQEGCCSHLPQVVTIPLWIQADSLFSVLLCDPTLWCISTSNLVGFFFFFIERQRFKTEVISRHYSNSAREKSNTLQQGQEKIPMRQKPWTEPDTGWAGPSASTSWIERGGRDGGGRKKTEETLTMQ